MKRNILSLIVLLCITCIWGQAPNKMSYQAVVRDANNNLVANQAIGLQVSILSGSPDGTSLYEETHNSNSNINGLISIVIGEGNPINGSFSDIDWASSTYYIKTEIDPEGGANYTIVGVQQLLSVPYAMHAKTADNLGGIEGTELGEMLYWNGTSWVTIPPGNNGQTLSYCDGKPVWGFCIETIIGGQPTATTMRVNGKFNPDGTDQNSNVEGICFSTTPNPTISDSFRRANSSLGGSPGNNSWSVVLANLSPNTTYYARAFIQTTVNGSLSDIVEYASNEVSFTTTSTYVAGDYYPDEGGVIFYILQPSDVGYDANTPHGLVVSLNNISTNPEDNVKFWGCSETSIPGTLSTIGSGSDNTSLIVNGCTDVAFAAKSCYEYSSMGFNDWYLGSSQEMLQLGLNWNLLRASLTAIEGADIAPSQLWTSTESSEFINQALKINMSISENIETVDKNSLHLVRPIRSF